MERIRNSSAYELVRHIKVFIATFTAMDGPPDNFSTYFQRFIDVSNVVEPLAPDSALWVGITGIHVHAFCSRSNTDHTTISARD